MAQQTFAGRALADQNPREETLVFPGLLNKEALEAGNPLATYAAMLDLEPQYQRSRIFSGIYPEIRFNFEQFRLPAGWHTSYEFADVPQENAE